MNFLTGLTFLLLYQLVGEVIVLVLDIAIPGPVIGMILLFITLMLRKGFDSELEESSTTLLSHLSLLFVPAGVGVMVHFERILDEWLPIALTLVLSTVFTMMITALIMCKTSQWINKGESDNE